MQIRTFHRMLLLIALAAVCAGANLAAKWDGDELSPREALQSALRTLMKEAGDAKETFQLPRQRADFATQFGHKIDAKLIADKLMRPVDKDAFTDAYVRWQLTSFLDGLPEMEDVEFEQFLDNLPPCIQNPQISATFVPPLLRASQAPQLAPSDQKVVQGLLDNLKAQRDQAAVMRRPADELRTWILKSVGTEGPRPIQVALEMCAALAQAGWDIDRVKVGIEEFCDRALRDRTFTERQRARVAKQAEALSKISVLRLNDASLTDGRVSVNTEAIGVPQYEAHKWARRILAK